MLRKPTGTEAKEIRDDDFVSIIWVHYALTETRSEMARASLATLIETTFNIPCEITVVDNGGSLEDSMHFVKLADEKKIQHYIRNGDNMHFSYARNQAIRLASGKYIAISDDDIIFDHGWLQMCVGMLKEFPDKKFVASIIYYPYTSAAKDRRYHAGEIQGKRRTYKLNQRAGSNQMVMRREVFDEVGTFPLHRIGGSYFVDNLVRAGYLTILPPEKYRGLAKDCGLRRGYNLKAHVDFVKTLTDKSKKHYEQYA